MAASAHTLDFNAREDDEWRAVLGWEGFYEVSSAGLVRSLDRVVEHEAYGRTICRLFRGKTMNWYNSKGYPHVRLSAGERRRAVGVHVLVCEAFHGPRPDRHDAAHNDGNPFNPHAITSGGPLAQRIWRTVCCTGHVSLASATAGRN